MKPIPIAIAVLLLLLPLVWWLWTPDKSRAELESKYLFTPADMMDVAGTRLHVRDAGPKAAPAVLLLHGFGSSLQTWEPWAKPLSGDMRVISLDLPGSGLSPPDPRADYSDAQTITVLLALMDKLGIQRFSIVGNSIGGRIGWTLAATHPDRINKLVLVSPDGFASPGFEYGKKPDVPAMVKLMRYTLPKHLLRMSLEPAYANPNVLTDAIATRYHDLMLGPGTRDAMIARMQQTVLVNPLPLLSRITAPTLLAWGEKDAMIPFANSADYLKAISGSTLIAFPGIGHLPQEEAPAQTIIAVHAFLRASP